MGKFVSAFLGGGEAPKASTQPAESVTEDAEKSKKSRARLLETQGGASGEEINPDSVGKRPTLLGN